MLVKSSGNLLRPTSQLASAGCAPITLGNNGQEVVPLHYSTRECGVLVQGSSGYGKTRLLVELARSDIRRSLPGILLDPVGTTGKLLLEYLGAETCALKVAERAARDSVTARFYRGKLEALHKRIHILDLSDPQQTHRINVCKPIPGLTAAQTVEAVFLPVLKKELGELTEARRLLMVVRSALVPVVEAGGCLADVLDLLSISSQTDSITALCRELDLRHHRLGKRPGIIARYFRELYLMLPKGERLAHTQSAWHALGTILGHPTCARLFGSTTSTFDIPSIIAAGGYMIVIIPQREGAACSVIASTVLGLVTQACQQRSIRDVQTGRCPEVFMTVDEFHLALGQDRSIHDLVATCRNIGLRLCVAFQHEKQGDLGRDPTLIANWRANTATHIYFRCGLDSAREYIAEHVHRPQGLRVKRRYEQRTQTQSQTQGLTVSRQISMAVALAKSRGVTSTLSTSEGQTISITRSHGTTVVETEGLSISEGNTFQSVHAQGFSFTRSEGESTVNGHAVSHSNSESHGQSHGTSSGVTQSRTRPLRMGAMGAAFDRVDPSTGAPQRPRTLSTSKSETRNHNQSTQFSNAVSDVISEANARSSSEATTESTSSATGRARSHQIASSNSLARGISRVRALAVGLSKTVGRSQATSESISRTQTTGQTEGLSLQVSRSKGESVRVVEELYTLEEETRILAYEIASLPRQHAMIVSDAPDGSRVSCKFKVVDVPDVQTRISGVDGLGLLLENCAGPKTAPPAPRSSLFDRVKKQTAHPLKTGGKP